MAERVAKRVKIDDRQKAMGNMDGCNFNTFLLDLILNEAKSSLKNLYMASVDVAKAFPSVSHATIKAVMQSFGFPDPLLRYIDNLCTQGTTVLQGQGWVSKPIPSKRGERHGDPLSPIIFNMVMHRYLERLPSEIGFRMGITKTNASAIADYVNLFATTSAECCVQELLDVTVDLLSHCGMQVNADKSFTLRIRASTRDKISIVGVKTTFTRGDQQLRFIKRNDSWKYLGVMYC